MENCDFQDIKAAYEKHREEERRKLSTFLNNYIKKNKIDLTVVRRGSTGKGRKNYTSNGKIEPYDLSNWKWVEIKEKDSDFDCVVSLNMPDVDTKSGNFHALFDRVGLLIEYPNKSVKIYTNIDLPFDDEKMERIAALVVEQFEFYQYCAHKNI